MVKKVLATLAAAGAFAFGAGGTAAARPGPCTNAADRIARLQAEESRLAAEVASLEARASRHHRGSWEIRRQIGVLTQDENRVTAEILRLQTACPGTPSGTVGTGTTGGAPPTTNGNPGSTTIGSTFAD